MRSFDKVSGQFVKHHYADDIVEEERHCIRLEDHTRLLDSHDPAGCLYSKPFLTRSKIVYPARQKRAADALFSFYTAYHAERISLAPSQTVHCRARNPAPLDTAEPRLLAERDSLNEILRLTTHNGNDAILDATRLNAAVFASDLDRPRHVYGENSTAFKRYLHSLVPLVETLPPDALRSLPPAQRDIARALRRQDFDAATAIYASHDRRQLRSAPRAFRAVASLVGRLGKANVVPTRKLMGPETDSNRGAALDRRCQSTSIPFSSDGGKVGPRHRGDQPGLESRSRSGR